jgi:hypothetical protein
MLGLSGVRSGGSGVVYGACRKVVNGARLRNPLIIDQVKVNSFRLELLPLTVFSRVVSLTGPKDGGRAVVSGRCLLSVWFLYWGRGGLDWTDDAPPTASHVDFHDPFQAVWTVSHVRRVPLPSQKRPAQLSAGCLRAICGLSAGCLRAVCGLSAGCLRAVSVLCVAVAGCLRRPCCVLALFH